MKLCVHCKWYMSYTAAMGYVNWCYNPKIVITSAVDGGETWRMPDSVREDPLACGPSGQWWEAKPITPTLWQKLREKLGWRKG